MKVKVEYKIWVCYWRANSTAELIEALRDDTKLDNALSSVYISDFAYDTLDDCGEGYAIGVFEIDVRPCHENYDVDAAMGQAFHQCHLTNEKSSWHWSR